jgi:hypothetical protein
MLALTYSSLASVIEWQEGIPRGLEMKARNVQVRDFSSWEEFFRVKPRDSNTFSMKAVYEC